MGRFSPDMLIKDAIAAHPGAADVFERHGLGCGSCLAAEMESVAAAASVHDVPLDILMLDLDTLVSSDEPGMEL